jgi:hypothetical protein
MNSITFGADGYCGEPVSLLAGLEPGEKAENAKDRSGSPDNFDRLRVAHGVDFETIRLPTESPSYGTKPDFQQMC